MNAAQLKSTAKHQVYGSFYLNETELVLSVEHIQEVVNYPSKVTTIPLAPDFLVGIFNLRGAVIPMINVKVVLGFDHCEVNSAQKVAIIDYNGVRIGLLFDSTSEILHIREEQLSEFRYSDESRKNVIKGAVKMNDGERILQVLDPMALVNIENLPQVLARYENQENPFTKRRNLKNANRRQCISFGVGDTKLAFQINSIHEIIKMPELQESVMEHDECVGMISLRGNVVPVIDFSSFLGFGKNTQNLAEKRIIVMKFEQYLFGLMIDQVENIVTYYTEDVLPLPVFNQKRAEMFDGVLSKDEDSTVILLNHASLLSNHEVRELTQGHSKLYEQRGLGLAVSEKKKAGKREVFVSFRMNHLIAVPIQRIREIIEYPENILTPPGMPAYVKGVVKLRSEMVTLIDLRKLYEFEPLSDLSSAKVIVVKKDELNFGFLVDSVESIVSIDLNEKLGIPKVFIQSAGEGFQADIEEIVEVKTDHADKKCYLLLNLDALMGKIGT